MKISFQKRPGDARLGVEFFWSLTIQTKTPSTLFDQFIPELFYDFFLIHKGQVSCFDKASQSTCPLASQTLKTLHTRPLTFQFAAPLTLLGARLSLTFAERYWAKALSANAFIESPWVNQNINDLDFFAAQVSAHLHKHQTTRSIAPLVSATFTESQWLAAYSPRHKSRLYKTVFGLSRKELQGLHNVHLFLQQACEFETSNPRIIQHVNADVFYDQAHLNHAFKKVTGFSPVEYFQANSILQDNLMAASYNEISSE